MQDADSKLQILKQVTFGQRVAEEDLDRLQSYFVETDQWRQLYDGQVDIVFGAKGSGKSALYFLLQGYRAHFRNAGTVLVSAENPRGAPAFRAVSADVDVSEAEFLALWKLYFAGVLATALLDADISSDSAKQLFARLHEAGVWRERIPLQRLLASAFEYVKRLLRPSAVEGGVTIDPVTGTPTGLTGKILFSEPTPDQRSTGVVSVDELLELADTAFRDEGLSCWILLDRLDVAFADTPDLEKTALRSLFRAYLDLNALDVTFLKIFLRTDIWQRITKDGFREASHITRSATIRWSPNDLLNLAVKRLLANSAITEAYGVDVDQTLHSIDSQREFFYRIFPGQVEVGQNKPTGFDWILGRTRDGSRDNAPRELIHFLERLREVQVRALEIGDSIPEDGLLFSRAKFKEALHEVSQVRFEQTLLAEYPSVRDRLIQLEGQKSEHSVETLSAVWRVDLAEAKSCAEELVFIGFFEKRGERTDPRYWIPFLYRDALSIVQGSAD